MENSKLREALRAALEQVNKVYDILSRPCVVIEEARQGCREARGVLIPALAEPVKNCEVGSVAEQMKRQHDTMCNTSRACPDSDWSCKKCFAEWSQMPYEGGSKNEN